MTALKKILVPYDFSKYAQYALEFACQLAEKNLGTITILNVIDYPTGMFSTPEEVIKKHPATNVYVMELIRLSEAKLEKAILEAGYKEIDIKYDVKLGNPFHAIAGAVTNSKADLIVMGTKGSSGMEELVVGSNAEKVVRYAHCPVITISDNFKLNAIKNIAFATNLEDDQDVVIQEFKKYQEWLDANLHLVWINTFQMNQDLESTRKRLRELVQRNGLKNTEVYIHRAIVPERGILHFAGQNTMDMIAMATHGHKGLLHLFVGSIAEDVVNHAKIPVWTYSLQKSSQATKKSID